MKAFPDRPRLELIDFWEYQFELMEDYRYSWSYRGDDYRLTARTGFITDLASIPKWIPKWVARSIDLTSGAPLYHDALYRSGGDTFSSDFIDHEVWTSNGNAGTWTPVTGAWSRDESDRLFGRMMREAGVPRWRRRSAYRLVQLFSSFAWDKDEYL